MHLSLTRFIRESKGNQQSCQASKTVEMIYSTHQKYCIPVCFYFVCGVCGVCVKLANFAGAHCRVFLLLLLHLSKMNCLQFIFVAYHINCTRLQVIIWHICAQWLHIVLAHIGILAKVCIYICVYVCA